MYNNLVITTKGTYRLWDKDFMYCIDLSQSERETVCNLLTKAQKNDIYGEITYKTVLSDVQIQTLRDDPLFWQEV